MILQALVEYYDRKTATGSDQTVPDGYELKDIPFFLILDLEGNLISIEDARELVGKKKIAKKISVPSSIVRSGSKSYETAFLMWDHIGYVLGIAKSEDEKDKILAEKQHQVFKLMVQQVQQLFPNDIEIWAVYKFLSSEPKQQIQKTHNWQELLQAPSTAISFKLAGNTYPITYNNNVASISNSWDGTKIVQEVGATDSTGFCLVSGDYELIPQTHNKIKGISGQTIGGSIVSFNQDAFSSYGKIQNQNSPIGKTAASKYIKSLNLLLDTKNNLSIKINTTHFVFWGSKENSLEGQVKLLFDPPLDDPDAYTTAVRSLFSSIKSGTFVNDHSNDRFYVLGLSATSVARVAVRYWNISTVAIIGAEIANWFMDIDIVGRQEYRYPSLTRLIASTVFKSEVKRISDNLSGDTMRSILAGLPLPETLLQAAVRRNRAEQNVTYTRAALLKACLNRNLRFTRSTNPLYPVALDPEHPNPGYQLGRLFAVLEKIQTEASPGLNSTIRERYYGAASSTPATVFPLLLRLKNHHVAKISNPRFAGAYENRIRDIVGNVQGFPKQLTLADQGAFAIGYYHQQQDFYTKKNTDSPNTDSATPQSEDQP